ncbi:hypothetical protein UFOVP116_285 [uncultured Caudovirales phage]|uniref:Uncharacterized protein n=1 Tax=uncultured Caudovirales phage TaxID=2100421 RepID=A0A6J5L6U9_9CAUD|nr:hypothetical protein UFOVP116_285 [uncultured Caudovirales phage]
MIKNIFADFKKTFQKPSAVALAQQELEDAERSLLEALSSAEYAKRIGEYHSDRIKRLNHYLRDFRQ